MARLPVKTAQKRRELELMIPPEPQLGPVMKALPLHYQAFVMACVNMGVGVNNTEAARIAGFGGDKDTLKVTAHKLFHDPRVQSAIQEVGRMKLRVGTMEAIALLVEQVRDGDLAPKDRRQAAIEILNRGGLHAMSEHTVTVTHTPQSRAEKLAELKSLALSMGMDPRSLLGNLADVVEGDLKVINEGENDGTGQQESGTKGK